MMQWWNCYATVGFITFRISMLNLRNGKLEFHSQATNLCSLITCMFQYWKLSSPSNKCNVTPLTNHLVIDYIKFRVSCNQMPQYRKCLPQPETKATCNHAQEPLQQPTDTTTEQVEVKAISSTNKTLVVKMFFGQLVFISHKWQFNSCIPQYHHTKKPS